MKYILMLENQFQSEKSNLNFKNIYSPINLVCLLIRSLVQRKILNALEFDVEIMNSLANFVINFPATIVYKNWTTALDHIIYYILYELSKLFFEIELLAKFFKIDVISFDTQKMFNLFVTLSSGATYKKYCFANGLKSLKLFEIIAKHSAEEIMNFTKYKNIITMEMSNVVSSIWRKTIIGQALLDALIDISNLHKSLSQENLFVILLIFDQIMSKVVAETKGSLNIRITSGNLSQYKSIDDTWIFVVKNIKLKLKTQHIFSPSIHIMATDYKK